MKNNKPYLIASMGIILDHLVTTPIGLSLGAHERNINASPLMAFIILFSAIKLMRISGFKKYDLILSLLPYIAVINNTYVILVLIL
jgi:hypothetical protein